MTTMKPPMLLIPAVVILAQAAALADGGTVQLRKEAGGVLITLFTAPAPLSVGPVDISLLLQDRNRLDPILDANISLVLRHADSGTEFAVRPTRERASNKLLYAAPVTLPKAGKWQIAIDVGRNGVETGAVGVLNVASAPKSASEYGAFIAFPLVIISLFIVREVLIRRRLERGRRQEARDTGLFEPTR